MTDQIVSFEALQQAFETLGVSPNATEAEVKKAFKAAAKKWHPDLCKEPYADQKLSEVVEAHKLLVNHAWNKPYFAVLRSRGHLEHQLCTGAENIRTFADLTALWQQFQAQGKDLINIIPLAPAIGCKSVGTAMFYNLHVSDTELFGVREILCPRETLTLDMLNRVREVIAGKHNIPIDDVVPLNTVPLPLAS
jgi:hypothetical protein